VSGMIHSKHESVWKMNETLFFFHFFHLFKASIIKKSGYLSSPFHSTVRFSASGL